MTSKLAVSRSRLSVPYVADFVRFWFYLLFVSQHRMAPTAVWCTYASWNSFATIQNLKPFRNILLLLLSLHTVLFVFEKQCENWMFDVMVDSRWLPVQTSSKSIISHCWAWSKIEVSIMDAPVV